MLQQGGWHQILEILGNVFGKFLEGRFDHRIPFNTELLLESKLGLYLLEDLSCPAYGVPCSTQGPV